MFWNWIGRSQEEIEQAREDWMDGSRFGEVKGYDGDPLPAPELPPTRTEAAGKGALTCGNDAYRGDAKAACPGCCLPRAD